MSLVGHKAKSHPQQTLPYRSGNDRRWHPDVEQDDRAITMDDFAPLHERFGFTVDAAAAEHNARLPRYWTRDVDALAQSWHGERIWCNPPYSDIRVWVEKAWRAWEGTGYCVHSEDHGCPPATAELIVMLLPANRTEQGWWQDFVEPALRDGRIRCEFLRGRMRFLRPGQTAIGPNERPPFGCCLLIWEPRP